MGSVVADHRRVVCLRVIPRNILHGSLHSLVVVSCLRIVFHVNGHHPDSELRVEFEDGFEQRGIA